MKHTKHLIGLALVLCALSLAGCGTNSYFTDNNEKPQTSNSENPAVTGNDENVSKNPMDNNDANSLISLSSIQGDVIQFSDENCVITPIEYSADGNKAIIAAPGNDSSDTNVTVHYQSGCVFKIANISISSGTATFTEADISDIKKQTSLIIYGDWSDKHNLNATQVIIARYE